MLDVRRYLAEIGRRGGIRSRRRLDPATAREMVRIREARRDAKRTAAAEQHGHRGLSTAADTSAVAGAVQDAVIRRLSATQKLTLLAELSRTVDALAREGVKRRHPDADDGQRHRHFAELRLGALLAARVYDAPRGES